MEWTFGLSHFSFHIHSFSFKSCSVSKYFVTSSYICNRKFRLLRMWTVRCSALHEEHPLVIILLLTVSAALKKIRRRRCSLSRTCGDVLGAKWQDFQFCLNWVQRHEIVRRMVHFGTCRISLLAEPSQFIYFPSKAATSIWTYDQQSPEECIWVAILALLWISLDIGPAALEIEHSVSWITWSSFNVKVVRSKGTFISL